MSTTTTTTGRAQEEEASTTPTTETIRTPPETATPSTRTTHVRSAIRTPATPTPAEREPYSLQSARAWAHERSESERLDSDLGRVLTATSERARTLSAGGLRVFRDRATGLLNDVGSFGPSTQWLLFNTAQVEAE